MPTAAKQTTTIKANITAARKFRLDDRHLTNKEKQVHQQLLDKVGMIEHKPAVSKQCQQHLEAAKALQKDFTKHAASENWTWKPRPF